MNTYKLTATDRCVINRFLLSEADKIEFSTNCIRQPLSLEKLEIAFQEVEAKAKERIEKTRSLLNKFDNGELPEELKAYYGDAMKREDIIEYIDRIIRQESEVVKSIKNTYMISVDNEFWGDDKAKELHCSFNPRVTFGYSNKLHEECKVALTDELKKILLKTQLCKRCSYNECFSFGAFTIDEITCSFYEDTKLFINGNCVMETISHEQIYDLYLSDELMAKLLNFEDKKDRNEKIIKKLNIEGFTPKCFEKRQ